MERPLEAIDWLNFESVLDLADSLTLGGNLDQDQINLLFYVVTTDGDLNEFQLELIKSLNLQDVVDEILEAIDNEDLPGITVESIQAYLRSFDKVVES